MNTQKQKGFSALIIVLLIALVGVIGFVAWRMYDANQQAAKQQATTTQNNQNTTKEEPRVSLGVDQYFEPANVSFSHPAKWTYDTAGLTMEFAGQPDLKYVSLNLPYQGANDKLPSRYSISLRINSTAPEAESTIKSFDSLGEVQLGKQKLYILRAYYDPEQVGNVNKIITSGCADKQCAFKLTDKNLYFEMGAGKVAQAPQSLDDAMVPEIVSILKTIRIGK